MDNKILYKIINQDIKAALKAFQLEEFEMVNVYGNRIMSDAIFGNDGKVALPGFFAKQVGILYLGLKQKLPIKKFNDAKWIGKEYISKLCDFSEGTKVEDLWSGYQEFFKDIRVYIVSDIEAEVYEENPDITRAVLRWQVHYLDNTKEVLYDPNNLLFKGIINEIDRTARVYSCELRDTCIICLLVGLDRFFDYFRIAFKTPEGGINKDKVREIVFPYVEKIAKIAASDEEIKLDVILDILWALIKGWRQFFINYMELLPRISEKPVELPEESKKKLSEAIGKALEKEIKP